MIVIIAPEYDIVNEIVILNQLFEAGLEYYHFRKPYKNYEEHCVYLNQIDKKFHSKIMVHFHHELINDYSLKGIHFQEQKRKSSIDKDFIKQKKNLTISSSFHSVEELAACNINFDYHLLSPVFSSISKTDYKGKGFDVNHLDKKIIGMGGVTTKNLTEFTKLGFNGVGVLGGIWNSDTPISNFKKMNQYFKKAHI